MSAFLLTWKESEWPYENILRLCRMQAKHGYVDEPWRLHAHRRANVGDRVWLLKQGRGQKGIFGVGAITGPPKLGDAGNGKHQMMAPVRFSAFVDPTREMLIDEDALRQILPDPKLRARASGDSLSDEVSQALETILANPVVQRAGNTARVTEIHVVCRGRQGVKGETAELFSSGTWVIAEDHLRTGVLFALHESKSEASYLQGEIESHAEERLNNQTRFRVSVRRTARTLAWRGGGSGETGYLWDGHDFDGLQRLTIAINPATVGGNAAIKSLLEARDWRYPKAASLAKDTRGKGRSRRQALFEHELVRIAATNDEFTIPYAFMDQSGLPCRLDDGAIKIAIGQGFLKRPPQSTEDCREFQLTEQEAARRAKQIRDLRAAAPGGQMEHSETSGARAQASADPFAAVSLEQASAAALREEITRSVLMREGQPEFRRDLILAYGSKCALTGCDVVDALDAAHIIPHALIGNLGMHVANGLLLRGDIHTLFDKRLLAIHEEQGRLVSRVSKALQGTSYAELDGRSLQLPVRGEHRPSPTLLKKRNQELPLR